MACNIEQAIDALLTFKGTSVAITKIISDSIAAENKFYEFIAKDMPSTVGTISSSTYIESFTKYLKQTTGVNVVESKDFVRDFVLGKSGNVFRQGELQHVSNTLKLADSKEVGKFITSVASELKSTSLTAAERSRLNSTLGRLQSFKSEQVLLHELVHATSAWSLREDPTSEASLRVSELFEYVLKSYPDIGTDAYWKTNTKEFLSEALSDPKLMTDLMNIKLAKPLGSITTIYKALMHTVLQTLGFKGKELDTAYKVMLDSSLAMLEDRNRAEGRVATETPSKAPTSPKVSKEVQVEAKKETKPSESITVTKSVNGTVTYKIGDRAILEVIDDKIGPVFIGKLLVDEKYRNKGLAARLLKAVIKEYGNDEIHLIVDPVGVMSDSTLISIYEKYGFILEPEEMPGVPKMIRYPTKAVDKYSKAPKGLKVKLSIWNRIVKEYEAKTADLLALESLPIIGAKERKKIESAKKYIATRVKRLDDMIAKAGTKTKVTGAAKTKQEASIANNEGSEEEANKKVNDVSKPRKVQELSTADVVYLDVKHLADNMIEDGTITTEAFNKLEEKYKYVYKDILKELEDKSKDKSTTIPYLKDIKKPSVVKVKKEFNNSKEAATSLEQQAMDLINSLSNAYNKNKKDINNAPNKC